MTTRRPAALGVDVGSTSVKAGLVWLDDEGGVEVVGRPYPTHRPRPGWAEQDPADWVDGLAWCWTELVHRVGPVELRSVGVCSQVNTHVLTDRALRPLTPAITWQDLRCATEAAELDAIADARRTELWGGPFTIDASFSLSRALWVARHDPDAFAAARWIMSPRDFVVAALTGDVVTDTMSPIGVVGPDGDYLRGVIDLVPDAARLLPPVRPFDALAGVTRAGVAGLPEGVPVAVGSMDAFGNVYGSGLVAPGRAMEVAGTSEILAVASDRTVPTPGVISFAPVGGLHIHAGPTQAGGDSLAWAGRVLGLAPGAVIDLAAEALRDPQPIVFLPYLAGERAPLWDPDARGTFLGITTSTESRHLALAVLEGVAFSARHLLGECERAAGVPVNDLRLSGGGARSEVWNRIKASVHGRPLSVLATPDSAMLGAAIMGLVAAGLEPDLTVAAERHARVMEVVEPDVAARARLDDLYGVYREAYGALRPLFTRLARGSVICVG
ncbi:MAG: xylulose kinase [Chloroflexi bacterium]|nr:xylulose kinase [Chloroflexota bacterium]